LRRRFVQQFGVGQPYLIADIVWFAHDKRVKRNTAHAMMTRMMYDDDDNDGKQQQQHPVWDSITAYNRYEGRRDETLDVYLKRAQDEYHLYANPPPQGWFQYYQYYWLLLYSYWWGRRPTTVRFPVVPYVQPGYDDLLIRSHEHGVGIQRPAYPRGDQGQTYHQFWDLAERLLDQNPCHTATDEDHDHDHGDVEDDSFVLITSFNEWHESTSIEPSLEWGDQMLKITKERGQAVRPTCDASARRP
jgi:hypothetical protein